MIFSQRMRAQPLCFAYLVAVLSGCAPHGSDSEDSGTNVGEAQRSRHDASRDQGSEPASDAAVSGPSASDASSSGRDAGGQIGGEEDAGGSRDAGGSANRDGGAASKDAGMASDDAGPPSGNTCGGIAGLSCGSSKGTSCDRRPLTCRRAEPLCPEGQVVEIVGNCFGDCVRIDACACSEAAACPQPEKYTCHMSAMHCGPFVN
jgi:hypothetical protein